MQRQKLKAWANPEQHPAGVRPSEVVQGQGHRPHPEQTEEAPDTESLDQQEAPKACQTRGGFQTPALPAPMMDYYGQHVLLAQATAGR